MESARGSIGCRCRPMSAKPSRTTLRCGRPRGFGRTVVLACEGTARWPVWRWRERGGRSRMSAGGDRAGQSPPAQSHDRHRAVAPRRRAAGDRSGAAPPEHRQRPRSMPRSTAKRCRAGAAVAREPVMSALSEAVDDYLALRRALGYKLERARPCAAAVRRVPRAAASNRWSPPRWRSSGRPSQQTPASCGGISGWRSCAGSPATCRRSDPRHEVPPVEPAASQVPPRRPVPVSPKPRSRR